MSRDKQEYSENSRPVERDEESTEGRKRKKRKTAKEELTRYLGTRMRTVEESRRHLREKEYDEGEIREALDRFLQLGYLDDADYCKVYCAQAFGKCRGRRRIENELRQRGVDLETIRNAVEDYIYEENVDEMALARKLTSRCLEGCEMPPDQRMVAKVARKLEQQGYSTSIILSMLNEIKD